MEPEPVGLDRGQRRGDQLGGGTRARFAVVGEESDPVAHRRDFRACDLGQIAWAQHRDRACVEDWGEAGEWLGQTADEAERDRELAVRCLAGIRAIRGPGVLVPVEHDEAGALPGVPHGGERTEQGRAVTTDQKRAAPARVNQ
jgi:hypothetical protein